mmetsp:Transcript_31591/g.87132  ORF Transcript_31591/g.87132 Transcript_31591/m.87132 type:complete len:661 (+) Transcript_31591:117-2099(+)
MLSAAVVGVPSATRLFRGVGTVVPLRNTRHQAAVTRMAAVARSRCLLTAPHRGLGGSFTRAALKHPAPSLRWAPQSPWLATSTVRFLDAPSRPWSLQITTATDPRCGLSGPLVSQARSFGSKRSRSGRLQHFLFGTDKVKGRWYYRFHKIVGKWNWRKYRERYVAPRAIENRQRLTPSMHATYTQVRHSYSWYWRLPRGLADATTANEVLETWIQFRHKLPKKTYHYFKVLKRLTDVGGCDGSDWRLMFITSRLHRIHRKVLNLPRLANFYAQLRVIDELEHLTRFLYPMLPKYSPQQLALTAHAFGTARLQDKRIFSDVARLLDPQLDVLSPTEVVRLVQAYMATEVCHYTFLTRISAQAQVRVQQASEGKAPWGSCPTFAQLVDIAEGFAKLKFQDYSYFEMCTLQAEHLLRNGLSGPTPPALAKLCTASARLKIHDVHLYEVVLAHIADHWYDYPAASLAEVGAAVSPVLPHGADEVRNVYKQMLQVVRADRDKLTLRGVEMATRFMAELDHKDEFLPGMSQVLTKRLLQLRDEGQERYDVARVAEVFARRCPSNLALFSCLCKHAHRHLGAFEPVDFVRFARGLSASEYRDDRVVHALAKWAQKRLAEFSSFDWHGFVSALAVLGAREASLAKLRAVGPPLPQASLPGASASDAPI